MLLITSSASPSFYLAIRTQNKKNFTQVKIPQVSQVRKQDHQRTESHTNQRASLNVPLSPAQSPPTPGANSPILLRIHPGDPCTRQPKLLTSTWIHTPKKTWKKEKRTRERKLLAGLRPNRRLFGAFIGSFAVPTLMEEPDFALPFHPWGTRGRKTFIATTRTVLFSSREAMNVWLSLLGAQSYF